MENKHEQQSIGLGTYVPELIKINCMEPYLNEIIYLCGELQSAKARKSCPIIVIEKSGVLKSGKPAHLIARNY